MKSDSDTCVFCWLTVNCRTMLIVCGLSVGGLLTLPCPASGQPRFKPDVGGVDSAEATKEGPAALPQSQQSSEMVDEINSIRREVGGSVASVLADMFRDSEDGRRQLDREFEKGLDQLASVDASMDRVCAVLRKAARELDLVAADLEDETLYAEADMIRASAGSLRSRARAVAPSWASWASRAASAVQPEPAAAPELPAMGGPRATPENSGLPTSGSAPKIQPRQ